MKNHNRKVLIIGIDGGTWAVLKPAMEMGYMPFLKSLTGSGVSGILESTIPAITPAAWGTFLTGRNPGANGVYEFSTFDKKTKKFIPVNSTCLQKTLWQILSEAGKQVVSLNVPMTYPPQPVNGFVITGILTPSLASSFTYPSEFKAELLQQFPDYKILSLSNIPRKRVTKSKITRFIKDAVQLIKVHADVACYLLEKKPWDVFMQQFQETDLVQHMLFKYLDSRHPEYDITIQKEIFSTFYSSLDGQIRRIAELFASKNPGGITLVASDHGFESHYYRFGLGDWLKAEGFLAVKQTLLKNYVTRRFIETVYLKTEKILPEKIKVELRKLRIPQQGLIDWNHTRAFSVCSCGEGCIYLLEEDEESRKKTRNELIQKITAVKDISGTSGIVKKVHFRDELYSGPKMDFMPDIVLEPADGYSFTGPCLNKKKLFSAMKSEKIMNIGKHHKEGIFVVCGTGVKKQQKAFLRLLDVVPTVLYYMGISLPSSLEGIAAIDLFESDFVASTPLKKDQDLVNEANRSVSCEYSDRENELIQKRLQDLGYME